MRTDKPIHEVAIAIVRRGELWLVAKRRPDAHLGGMWEFPGGKCEPSESPAVAAVREVFEECGVVSIAQCTLGDFTVDYGDRVCNLHAVLCNWQSGEAHPHGSDECRWVTNDELRALEMPAINAQIITAATHYAYDRDR